MKPDETKLNQTKPKQIKSNQNETVKDNLLYFEIPLSESETMEMFTKYLRDVRKMNVTAHTGQFKKGQLFVGVLPDGVK